MRVCKIFSRSSYGGAKLNAYFNGYFPVLLTAILVYTAAICIVPTFSIDAHAARISDISNTKHNFSADFAPKLPGGASRVVSAVTENQICVFCHAPHGGTVSEGPLWNRELSGAQYPTYSSGSLDSAIGPGQPLQQPTGISKLCLSCHDGTMAVGAVNVFEGRFTDRIGTTEDIAMTGTIAGGAIAEGPSGRLSGFTRFLGTDLTNDHPISMTYDSALAAADGEMRDPAVESHLGTRVRGQPAPIVPLQDDSGGQGQVQCNTCHDPHIRDDTLEQNIKFLRLSRLQSTRPADVGFNPGTPVGTNADIICIACHLKAGWVDSAHANPDVADEIYTDAAANVREFPLGTRTWESACLACHDTHTVQGARRLTREGTDGPTVSVGGYLVKQGGRPAIEQTCYACHSSDGNTLTAQGLGTEVPDIKTDFTTLATRMPITTDDQSLGVNSPEEVHNIGDAPGIPQAGKDFIESQTRLANRHAECTDCHNPHRVIKNRLFNADPANPGPAGTHPHNDADLAVVGGVRMHTNVASGVLRGIWGVEPIYAGPNFNAVPNAQITFAIKRGSPPIDAPPGDDGTSSPYVTREYQVCFKCHSNYAYGNTPPMLGSFVGGTPSGTNEMTQYTNQASEYNSPVEHQGEGTAPNSGAGAAFAINNHRSWHPVVRSTGRTPAIRDANQLNWTSPFNLAVGVQTMYCTDCHGSDTNNGTSVPTGNTGGGGAGDDGRVWGPHGSENDFLLKGPWSGGRTTGTGIGQPTHLCFKCHRYNQYGNPSPAFPQNSGFSLGGGGGMCMMGGGGMGGGGMGGGRMSGGGGGMMCMPNTQNLHTFHANAVSNFRCNLCHIAVPHGWKNKAFLVNLNDVGFEGGFNRSGVQVRNGPAGDGRAGYFNGPYYNRAVLKVTSFALSGNWTVANCGSVGAPGNGATGVFWMAMSSEACTNVP